MPFRTILRTYTELVPCIPNDRIARRRIPEGTNAHGMVRQPSHGYHFLHQATPVHVSATRGATNRLDARNKPSAHICWDDRYLFSRQLENYQQLYLIEPDLVTGTEDIEVYNHAVYNICRYPRTQFGVMDMRGLYFFLLHAERNQARSYIRTIEIVNFTDGKYVSQAIQLLNTCRNLRRLTLRYCPRCREIRCRPNVWRAMKRLRAPRSLHRSIRDGGEIKLRFVPRPNRHAHFCQKCKDMGAQQENLIGGPGDSQRLNHLWESRMTTLRNSVLRWRPELRDLDAVDVPSQTASSPEEEPPPVAEPLAVAGPEPSVGSNEDVAQTIEHDAPEQAEEAGDEEGEEEQGEEAEEGEEEEGEAQNEDEEETEQTDASPEEPEGTEDPEEAVHNASTTRPN